MAVRKTLSTVAGPSLLHEKPRNLTACSFMCSHWSQVLLLLPPLSTCFGNEVMIVILHCTNNTTLIKQEFFPFCCCQALLIVGNGGLLSEIMLGPDPTLQKCHEIHGKWSYTTKIHSILPNMCYRAL